MPSTIVPRLASAAPEVGKRMQPVDDANAAYLADVISRQAFSASLASSDLMLTTPEIHAAVFSLLRAEQTRYCMSFSAAAGSAASNSGNNAASSSSHPMSASSYAQLLTPIFGAY